MTSRMRVCRFGPQQAVERHRADKPVPGIDDVEFVERVRKILRLPHVIDCLANAPEGRNGDQLALHEAAGGALGVVERALQRGALDRGHVVEDFLLLGIVETLEEVDRIVRLEVPHALGHRLAVEFLQDLAALALVELVEGGEIEVCPISSMRTGRTAGSRALIRSARSASCRSPSSTFRISGLFAPTASATRPTNSSRTSPWSSRKATTGGASSAVASRSSAIECPRVLRCGFSMCRPRMFNCQNGAWPLPGECVRDHAQALGGHASPARRKTMIRGICYPARSLHASSRTRRTFASIADCRRGGWRHPHGST